MSVVKTRVRLKKPYLSVSWTGFYVYIKDPLVIGLSYLVEQSCNHTYTTVKSPFTETSPVGVSTDFHDLHGPWKVVCLNRERYMVGDTTHEVWIIL